jgi:hypothetical protein
MQALIKGNRHQAAKAAADRRVPAVFISETKRGETVIRVGPQFERDIIKWFCEDRITDAPFPIGSCLHYSERDS